MGRQALGFAILLASGSASAQLARGTTVVLVSAKRAPPAAVHRLAEDVALPGGPSPAAVAAAIDRSFPLATPPSWDPASLMQKLAAAREDFYYGRFEKAAPAFAEVIEETRRRIDRIGGDERLAAPLFSGHVLHALSLVRTGRSSEASAAIRAAHALFPGRRPTVTEFGPEATGLWESSVEGQSSATLRVVAKLGGKACTIHRNGAESGPSPAVLGDVPVGESILQAACGSARSRLRALTVRAGAHSIEIDVAADLAIETAAWVGIRSAGGVQDARIAESIARALGAGAVVLLRVSGAEVDGTRVSLGRGGRAQVVAEGTAEVEDAEEMTALQGVLSGGDTEQPQMAAQPESPLPSPGAAAGDSRPSAGRGMAWWIAGGAGAIVAGVGSLLLVSGRSDAIAALEADSGPDRSASESSAETSLLLGAYLQPAGFAAVAAGATLFFLPADGKSIWSGPAYVAMLVGGAVLAGLGTSLLLMDDCESFDPLCPAQGPARGESAGALPFVLLGVGLGSVAAAVWLRLGEDAE